MVQSSGRPMLSALQFTIMMTSGYFVSGFFTFPRIVATAVGRAGVWSIVGDGLVFLVVLWVTFRVQRQFSDESLWVGSTHVLGLFWGRTLNGAVWVFHWALTVIGVAEFCFIIQEIFLPITPRFVIAGALVGTALYVAWHGTMGLARTLQAGFWPVVGLVLITAGFAISLIHYPMLAIPTFHGSLEPVVRSVENNSILFLGMPIMVTLVAEMDPAQRQRGECWAYGFFIAVIIILVFVYTALLATFGPTYLTQVQWPVVSLLRIVSVTWFWIDKFGLFALMMWTMVLVGFTAVRILSLTQVGQTWGVVPGSRASKIWLVGTAASIWYGGLLIPNATVNEWIAHWVLIPIGWGALGAMPGVLAVASWYRSFRKSKDHGIVTQNPLK
ncbi:MAG: hypothetical protein C7B46_20300 [Sulfobacillus benefaciens]|uniref:Uncharacterized protein n=1 Tax=Sulfobacillus benefaciens TaxID=453960 RepID=A0A2T2WV18_9FIRM|nr:MAG: hypothetical protein C7B46_20300 [Sulfobacillus benefaciens]